MASDRSRPWSLRAVSVVRALGRRPAVLWSSALLFAASILLASSRRPLLRPSTGSSPEPPASLEAVAEAREPAHNKIAVAGGGAAAAPAAAVAEGSAEGENGRFSRAPASFVQHLRTGAPTKPPGTAFKAFMYQCFLADAGALEHGPRHLTRHARPPKHTVGFFDAAAATAPGSGGGHPSGGGSRAGQQAAAAPPRRLRAVSFNVHFFRRGYSDVALSDSTEEVLAVVKQLNPDLLFLQEVPESQVASFSAALRSTNFGYGHVSAASSADVHVLPASMGTSHFANERLHVMVALKSSGAGAQVLQFSAVPTGASGHAAFAEVLLSSPANADSNSITPGQGPATALVYSVHLSVRCPAATRRFEVEAVLAHAAAKVATASTAAAAVAQGVGALPGGPVSPLVAPLVLVGGDMNQPVALDYPAGEWSAMARDLTAANLPLDDGGREAFTHAGFLPAFTLGVDASVSPDAATEQTDDGADQRRVFVTPASTAWNGAAVDFLYANVKSSKGPTSTTIVGLPRSTTRDGGSVPATRGVAAAGSWVVPSTASDHFPVVADFVLG